MRLKHLTLLRFFGLMALIMAVPYMMKAQTNYAYYAIHNKDKGYLKQTKGAVFSDGTFRYENAHDNNGSSIWVLSSDGYLQQEMYYLNVANDATLYLSTEKVTRWTIDDTTVSGKNLLKPNGSSKYLCADNGPLLKDSPSFYYNACEMTITENNSKWEGPKDVTFTVQSPQLVTYIRTYYIRNITAVITKNDNGATNQKVVDGKDSRCFCSLTYRTTSDPYKGTTWDINETTGVIYNKQASGDVSAVATFTLTPLDPKVLSNHPARDETVTLKLQPSPFAPDASKNYLLFYTKEANCRFPYDDGTLSEDDPVKTNASKSVLTDPANDQISWKVVRDDEGFYLFRNVESGRWLRFDESHYVTGSDYGVVEVGVNDNHLPTSNEYRFRLYKSGTLGNGSNQATYCILPFCRQWAVYKSDDAASNALAALNVYTSPTPKVISLWKVGDDSKYCILPYETEYRIRKDFSIAGPYSVNITGEQQFTAQTTYYRTIIGAATTGNAQFDLMIYGSENKPSVTFEWEITGLDGYVTSSSSVSNGTGTLTVNVETLPVGGSVTGTIKTKATGGVAPNIKSTDWKQTTFVLFPSATPTLTSISTLAQITSQTGAYKLTADITNPNDHPGVSTFRGFLDGDGHHIKATQAAPLFTTLTNATVRNLNIDKVTISGSGSKGAVAGTANGSTSIYNVGLLGGTVSSSDGYCGGLVGFLDGTARVINCFSYANITGGTYVGGLVGYNNVSTTSAIDNIKTMVMNCMFYGDITGGENTAAIYNGKLITNRGDNNGVGNYNYFRLEAPFVQPTGITYNCALGAEDRFLQRFEFYRHLLNSHRELAGWWATGVYDKTPMYKWVLPPDSIGTSHPYPVLMPFGKYPSVVNIDAENAQENQPRNKGGKLGELTVNIQMGNGAVYDHPGTGDNEAKITTSQLTLNITDKDPDHFNFNYYKVQLPYYNDVGTKNYTGYRVVTGWKIVSITGGTPGSFTTGDDAPAYNFADRNCTKKDLYEVSGRVFNQGAYWDVPEGVTAITIEPYWAKCAYLADAYADVVYNTEMTSPTNVPNVGGGQQYTNGSSYNIVDENDSQVVFTTMGNAIASSGSGNALFQGTTNPGSHTVYDYAVVLVGNYHHYYTTASIEASKAKPYTVTSIDLDGDNEPDYSYIMRFDGRTECHPLRVDFINIPGLGMAQKSTGGTGSYNFGILIPKGWYESTNTSLLRFTQFEYENQTRSETDALIVQGGVMEQWVSYNQKGRSNKIPYIHVGGNVWFKEFHTGCHQDKNQTSGGNRFQPTKHSPISVTGGDFDEFYLTGLYVANAGLDNYADNAECYINGGRFGTVCGAAMEGIGKADGADNTGNISWLIQNADIHEFYAGGLNAAKPVTGNLSTTIIDSHVDIFCGGPKFGDMSSDKTVVTTATGCTFGTFFGAGYGGNSYSRYAPTNQNNVININWNNWVRGQYTRAYNATYGGVSTRFSYQFLPMSDNKTNVARILVDFVKFSLATTHEVTSSLKHCSITGNFYGGGSLGKVDGPVTSTIDSCTVNGNVYGAGFSASLPTVEVDSIGFRTEPYYYDALGTYRTGIKGQTTTYTWEEKTGDSWVDNTNHILYTNENLKTLGTVTSNVTLTLTGNTTVGTIEGGSLKAGTGNVFGGGEESAVNGNTTVNLEGSVQVLGNVYGGGNNGPVGGSSEVKIQN